MCAQEGAAYEGDRGPRGDHAKLPADRRHNLSSAGGCGGRAAAADGKCAQERLRALMMVEPVGRRQQVRAFYMPLNTSP